MSWLNLSHDSSTHLDVSRSLTGHSSANSSCEPPLGGGVAIFNKVFVKAAYFYVLENGSGGNLKVS